MFDRAAIAVYGGGGFYQIKGTAGSPNGRGNQSTLA